MRTVFKMGLAVAGLVLLCTYTGAIGGVVGSNPNPPSNGSSEISYADFIVIMLTSVSVLMTLLAFMVAILAYVGWNNIHNKVQKETKNFLSDGFEEGRNLNVMFKQYASELFWSQVPNVDEDFERDSEEEAREE